MQTLVIKIDGWLGRVIAMSGAVTQVAKERPVKVITSRPLVFRWNPYIKSVHGLDDRRLYEDVIKGNDYFELEPYTDPEFFNDWKNWLYIACKQLKIECTEDLIPQPCLFLAEHEKLSNRLQWDYPILYQPFGSTMDINGSDRTYRSIPVDAAQEIAYWLVAYWFTPYLVIKPWQQPILDKCQILDTPDMRFVVSLCARYPVIWCDSALHHAAKAFNKQAIVIRAWTDSERYWYESHINMREYPMVNHTPLRLMMNDFNYDISNQNTNKFSGNFLNWVVNMALSLKVRWENWL